MLRLTCLITMGLLALSAAPLAAEDDNVPAANLKLKKAPDFKLKDQNGKEVSLADLRKEGNVALVFYRSASW